MLFRQDAVMQQVFGLMNNLLATAAPGSKSTNNKLSIRTFNVVPLSQRSGNFYMNLLVTIYYFFFISDDHPTNLNYLINEPDGINEASLIIKLSPCSFIRRTPQINVSVLWNEPYPSPVFQFEFHGIQFLKVWSKAIHKDIKYLLQVATSILRVRKRHDF